jgi:Na+-transporting methylmalonyl-CoA/oxaloacetate decarboxylase gamma subunit
MATHLLNLLLVADQSQGLLSNLSDARAGAISLVGLTAVFAGLLLIMLFMHGLAYATRSKEMPAAAPPPEAREPQPEATPEPVAEEPFVAPVLVGPLSLPAAALAAVHVARSLFEGGRFPLGEERTVTVDGRTHAVELVSVGLATVALVDGTRVVFYRTRVARNGLAA